jgi:hypothetical protein
MPKAFQPSHVVARHALRLEAIEKVTTQVGVSRSGFPHVIEDHQDRMAYGNERAFPAAAAGQPAILRSQIGIWWDLPPRWLAPGFALASDCLA